MPSHNITGRDGLIIKEALAFAYAAMKHLPRMFQPLSNMDDMRDILAAELGKKTAEDEIGKAMLLAWNLRADVTPSAGRTSDDLNNNLRRIRDQAMQEPADPDTPLLVRAIDRRLNARNARRG